MIIMTIMVTSFCSKNRKAKKSKKKIVREQKIKRWRKLDSEGKERERRERWRKVVTQDDEFIPTS